MIFQHADYRSFLKNTLAERAATNQKFSLRSMAGELGLGHSSLCEVIKGKKNLSPERAAKVANLLKLNPVESEYFCLLVSLDRTRDENLKSTIRDKIKGINPSWMVHEIELDHFKIISEWYYFPILEMTRLEGFKFEPKEISQRLGIPIAEAEQAVERLLRVGLLEKHDDFYRKTKQFFRCEAKASASEYINKVFEQMLRKAIQSINEQTLEERYLASETFAINPEQIPEAKQIIENFLNSMMRLADPPGPKKDVYHISTQLFSLTKRTS